MARTPTITEEDDLYGDDEDDFESEEDEASPEAYAIAETRKEALKHFELRIVADFIDWVPTLVDAISKGVFDGPELKAIMQAGLDRRDTVFGKPKPKSTPKPEAGNMYVGPVLGESGYVVNPVNYEPRTISFNGKRYAKDDLVGKVMRTDADSGQWYFRGLLVKVVSVGTAYMTIQFVENPQDKYPSSDILRTKSLTAGSQCRISFGLVSHIFG